MDHGQAFVQAIVEAPADDAPRLIYADWLEEQEDRESRDRAAFIRVQYALERLPADDPCRPQLEERQRDLLLAHARQWEASLSLIPAGRWTFRRGFIEKGRLDPASLLRFAEHIARCVPLRELQLDGFPYGIAPAERLTALQRLSELPLLGQLEGLDLAGASGDAELVRCLLHSRLPARLSHLCVDFSYRTWGVLSDSPHLQRLRALSLTSGGHSGTWMFASEDYQRHLAPVRTLASLGDASLPLVETLSLARWGHIPYGGMSLIASLDLPSLRKLELPGNGLTATDLAALLEAAHLDRVEELDLGHNRLGEAGCRLLASARLLPRLRRLVLNSNHLDEAAIRHLSQCDTLPALEALHLRTNRLGTEGFARLVGGSFASGLRVLHVGYNAISSRGVLDLVDAFPPRLAVLDLSWNPIGDVGVIVLASSPSVASLAALDLSYCRLTDEAALALARSPHLSGLRTLNLGTNGITDVGVRALAGSATLAQLEAINLGNNPVSDVGAQALLESPLLRRLDALHLLGTNVTEEARQRLMRQFRGILS